MLPLVARALEKCKTSQESARKDEEREIVCDHSLQNHFIFGGCLAVASPVHLLSLSFAPKQVKLITNGLYFLTEQIDIPEVKLSWCYTVMIKFSLNSCEQCTSNVQIQL